MKRDYIEFQDRTNPLAYLITFRCYGTWLHGDERGSVDRRHFNRYGAPKIAADPEKVARKESLLLHKPFVLAPREREVVELAIREVCAIREYSLSAVHVRTNHAHIVAGGSVQPERMMDSFKAYATRKLRAEGLLAADAKAWSRHGSTRYLWSEEEVVNAIDYVANSQGDELPNF